MEKILLVEDNETIVKGLKYSLEQEQFEVYAKSNVKDAKEDIDKNKYDIIILDISLPDGNGFNLCEYIKSTLNTPVIFLTAKDEEKDVVAGLDMGADDYIIKPFRMRELISRINRILKRKVQGNDKENLVKYKDITVDLQKMTVYKKEKEIILTALEYRILSMLLYNQDHIITREQVLEKIWDIAGNFVNDNTLTVYIKRIREKIEEDPTNPLIIKTVRGIGYKVGE